MNILVKVVAILGVPCLQNGTALLSPGDPLHNIPIGSRFQIDIADPCSGIRSLLSLTFLSVAYGYLFERRVWMRVALFAATVPIAIIANAGRVTLTGILTEYEPVIAEGAYHAFEGWVIFMVELVALLGAHRLLNRLTKRSHV